MPVGNPVRQTKKMSGRIECTKRLCKKKQWALWISFKIWLFRTCCSSTSYSRFGISHSKHRG